MLRLDSGSVSSPSSGLWVRRFSSGSEEGYALTDDTAWMRPSRSPDLRLCKPLTLYMEALPAPLHRTTGPLESGPGKP